MRIGHVHLKVSDIEKSLSFYRDLLGFQVTARYGDQAVFLSDNGYHHHIGLNTWDSKGAAPAPDGHTGLYHVAIVFETRKELAQTVKRLLDAGYPISGASNHGVSHAVYLADPDQNGIELYWDLPEGEWPKTPEGELAMTTEYLDIQNLIADAE